MKLRLIHGLKKTGPSNDKSRSLDEKTAEFIRRAMMWAALCRAMDREHDFHRKLDLLDATNVAERRLRDAIERIADMRGIDLDGVK